MKKKNIFLAILAVVLLVGVLIFIKGSQFMAMGAAMESMGEPPMSVSTIEVAEYDWQSRIRSIGSLEAVKGVTLTADLPGRVSKILFNAGEEVKAGKILIEQDVSSEKTQLRAAQASATLSKTNLDRLKELLNKGVVSKAEYDRAEAEYKSAIANADNVRTTLTKKTIAAPFDGKLGIRLVNLGQDINEGSPIVSLQQVDPIFINFSVQQKDLTKISAGLNVSVTSDALPGETFRGQISAINTEIDTATRSIRVQAKLENPRKLLLPGMFASVEVELPDVRKVAVVPSTAIKYSSYGDSVFVIEPKSAEEKVAASSEASSEEKPPKEQTENPDQKNQQLISRQQFVTLGKSRGDFVIVKKGVEVGELVATGGVFKLRNKGPVIINNDVVPEFSFEPTPEDQ